MTRLEDRQTLACTIAQARAEGARLSSACAVAGIDVRTLHRWQSGGDPAAPGWVQADRRPDAEHPVPSHALVNAARDFLKSAGRKILKFAAARRPGGGLVAAALEAGRDGVSARR